MASLAARPERYQAPRLPRPTLAAQGWRGPIPGDAVTLAAVPTLREAQGERPSCLSSHCSIVQPQRQTLLSSLHPRGRETETQSSRTRHRSCISPTSPRTFRRRDLSQRGHGSPSSLHSCLSPARPCQDWNLARAPMPLRLPGAHPRCLPCAPGRVPARSSC